MQRSLITYIISQYLEYLTPVSNQKLLEAMLSGYFNLF